MNNNVIFIVKRADQHKIRKEKMEFHFVVYFFFHHLYATLCYDKFANRKKTTKIPLFIFYSSYIMYVVLSLLNFLFHFYVFDVGC